MLNKQISNTNQKNTNILVSTQNTNPEETLNIIKKMKLIEPKIIFIDYPVFIDTKKIN